ncbi:hypothetical protein BT96DRAFT_958863 [Gymnopus androsaceus JB14]|uniref:Uncharacterized protein n=1 Tax=Gymnopus androsaceus JB14 TaxID=1447944 RepID=A0A6A4H8R5_9AGAR|nr:hypothetical protein BT96DRAFT_958863 [Gymnopus androsaceus JB14]
MESAIMKSVAHTANLCPWLHCPACPEACFVPANAPSQTNEFVAIKGVCRAYAKHNCVNFSGSSTHGSNASIIYRPIPDDAPIAGQIQWLKNKGDTVHLHVRLYQQLSKALYDPFLRYPHFSATTYSSVLGEKEDVINLNDIILHAAHYDYFYGRSILVNLSRQ